MEKTWVVNQKISSGRTPRNRCCNYKEKSRYSKLLIFRARQFLHKRGPARYASDIFLQLLPKVYASVHSALPPDPIINQLSLLYNTLMMEAVQTSKTIETSYQSTRRYSPEDGHLRSHRRKNLKSYFSHLRSISMLS
jgi:hypothetical protein